MPLNVIWIGGAPGAGKTSVAKTIARRHGFRWYGGDLHVWDHRARALARGSPNARRWAEMSHEDRLTRTSAAALNDLLLEAERAPMIVDDLRRLPSAPLTVAEGTPVMPDFVDALGELTQAVWLAVSREVQRARLRSQGPPRGVANVDGAERSWIERAALVADQVEMQVAKRRARLIALDAETTVAGATDVVEGVLADVIARARRAETLTERRELLRYENLVGARHHLMFVMNVPEVGNVSTTTYPFSCECAQTA